MVSPFHFFNFSSSRVGNGWTADPGWWGGGILWQHFSSIPAQGLCLRWHGEVPAATADVSQALVHHRAEIVSAHCPKALLTAAKSN